MRRRFDEASPIQRASKRGLDLLDSPAVLGERGADGPRVVEEDVDPDARVRAGDARHVAQGAAGMRERLVPFDAIGARLVDDHVREDVRHVARHRDERVVGDRVDRDRCRAERGDEAVDGAVAVRIGRGERGEEPGGTAEEVGLGRARAVRLEPCDRVPADEAARRTGGLADGGFRGTDVGDGRRLARGLEHLADRRGKHADRGCDHGQVRVGEGVRERGRGVDGAELACERERLGVGVPAANGRAAGPGSKPERRPDQTGADDRNAKRRGAQRGARISSARRNARSSDWRAFRRGSSSVW
jgi:hypothetical protein